MITVSLPRYITGQDLITLRKKIGWSEQAVADYLGLPHVQLLQLENGQRWISYEEEVLLKRLEEAFERGELARGAEAVDSEPTSLSHITNAARTANDAIHCRALKQPPNPTSRTGAC
jgi:transcriptional regulator with XRE-family HTH domain